MLGGTYEKYQENSSVNPKISLGIIERVDKLMPELEVKSAKINKGTKPFPPNFR